MLQQICVEKYYHIQQQENNIREWKHILKLRTNKRVHPSIRQVLIPLLKYFKEQMPEIFDDVEYDEEFNPKYYAKLSIEDF